MIMIIVTLGRVDLWERGNDQLIFPSTSEREIDQLIFLNTFSSLLSSCHNQHEHLHHTSHSRYLTNVAPLGGPHSMSCHFGKGFRPALLSSIDQGATRFRDSAKAEACCMLCCGSWGMLHLCWVLCSSQQNAVFVRTMAPEAKFFCAFTEQAFTDDSAFTRCKPSRNSKGVLRKWRKKGSGAKSVQDWEVALAEAQKMVKMCRSGLQKARLEEASDDEEDARCPVDWTLKIFFFFGMQFLGLVFLKTHRGSIDLGAFVAYCRKICPQGAHVGKVLQLSHSRFGDSGDAVGFAGGIVQEEMRITIPGVVQRDRVFDAHFGPSHGPS